jgi:hypothetical protein
LSVCESEYPEGEDSYEEWPEAEGPYDPIMKSYRLQVSDVLGIGIRTAAMVVSSVADGLHALADEVFAGANHRRDGWERRQFEREAGDDIDKMLRQIGGPPS